jgi:hypothetical protein
MPRFRPRQRSCRRFSSSLTSARKELWEILGLVLVLGSIMLKLVALYI